MCFSNSRLKVFAQPILSQRYFSPLCVASCSFSQDTAALPPLLLAPCFCISRAQKPRQQLLEKHFILAYFFGLPMPTTTKIQFTGGQLASFS